MNLGRVRMSFIANVVFLFPLIALTTTRASFVREGRITLEGYNFAFLTSFCGNATGPVVHYKFSYIQETCCYQLLSYFERQWWEIWPHPEMECREKTSVLGNSVSQVLNLTADNPRSGCKVISSQNGTSNVECRGFRVYQLQTEDVLNPKCWFLAISDCSSLKGIKLDYSLNVTGAEPNMAPNYIRTNVFAAVVTSILLTWFSRHFF